MPYDELNYIHRRAIQIHTLIEEITMKSLKPIIVVLMIIGSFIFVIVFFTIRSGILVYFKPTPLLDAASKSDWLTVYKQIIAGEDVNEVDERDHTAIMYACRDGNIQIIQMLIKHGANPNWKDNIGCDAFAWGRNSKNYTEIEKILINNSVNSSGKATQSSN